MCVKRKSICDAQDLLGINDTLFEQQRSSFLSKPMTDSSQLHLGESDIYIRRRFCGIRQGYKEPVLCISVQVEMIMRNLGLYNAKDTIVGNNSLRGVSGGERRRVTLGET